MHKSERKKLYRVLQNVNEEKISNRYQIRLLYTSKVVV